MGLRTSVYLPDELAAMWKASRLRLAEVIRRGLEAGGPVDEATMRRAVREIIRDELSAVNVTCSGGGGSGYGSRGYSDGYGSEPFEDIP